MAQPVWVLSVDLQTKTATFQTGMADAAKSARGSFQDIKSEAASMGSSTRGSMREANEAVIALGDTFGVHLPSAITRTVAGLETLGPALAAALPVAAIGVGAMMLIEHMEKLKEEADKLKDAELDMGTTVANVHTEWDNKLLEAGIRLDELNGDHVAALHKQLELIDHQSLAELVRSFDQVAKASDAVFADLKTSWYQFGAGSEGAKDALDEFKHKYESLMSTPGKSGDAHDLLAGTLQSAQRTLQLLQQVKDSQYTGPRHQGDYEKYEQAKLALEQQHISLTSNIEAQQTLVGALQAQVDLEKQANDVKAKQDAVATKTTQNKTGADSDKLYRAQTQAQQKEADEQDKLWMSQRAKAIANLEETEREKIDATRQGSAERLAVINSAIKEEESKGLQDEGFYRDLLTQRVNLVRQMALEEAKVKEEAGKEAGEAEIKSAQDALAAQTNYINVQLAMHKISEQRATDEKVQAVNAELAADVDGYKKQLAALDRFGADYENKKKAIEDKINETETQAANKTQQIQNQALEKQEQNISRAYGAMSNDVSRDLGQMLTRHETFAKTVMSLGDQMAQGLIENAMKAILADDMTKPHDAAAAARKAWLAGAHFPWPMEVIMPPILAAAAYASVMAFETGGIVPGVENYDAVPARLTPGEAVLPKSLTEHLMHKPVDTQHPGTTIHVHYAPQIHAMDGPSVDRVLQEHQDTFHRHFESHIRKMNR